jgi:hypothetical protein
LRRQTRRGVWYKCRNCCSQGRCLIICQFENLGYLQLCDHPPWIIPQPRVHLPTAVVAKRPHKCSIRRLNFVLAVWGKDNVTIPFSRAVSIASMLFLYDGCSTGNNRTGFCFEDFAHCTEWCIHSTKVSAHIHSL